MVREESKSAIFPFFYALKWAVAKFNKFSALYGLTIASTTILIQITIYRPSLLQLAEQREWAKMHTTSLHVFFYSQHCSSPKLVHLADQLFVLLFRVGIHIWHILQVLYTDLVCNTGQLKCSVMCLYCYSLELENNYFNENHSCYFGYSIFFL